MKVFERITKYTYIYLVLVLFVFPVFVFADGEDGNPSPSIGNPLKAQSLQDLIADILDVVVQIGTPIAVFFIIYSGFLFVKSQGNPEELEKAKKAFTGAIIGTAILLGAFAISEIIENTVEQIKSGGSVESEVHFSVKTDKNYHV